MQTPRAHLPKKYRRPTRGGGGKQQEKVVSLRKNVVFPCFLCDGMVNGPEVVDIGMSYRYYRACILHGRLIDTVILLRFKNP